MNRRNIICSCLVACLALASGCKDDKRSQSGMSEMERLKYENTLASLNQLTLRAAEMYETASENELCAIRDEIRNLSYDFDTEKMDAESQEKCAGLKQRIQALKNNPDIIFETSPGNDGTKLVSRKRMKLEAVKRFPFYFDTGDEVSISLDCQGKMKVSIYDINRHQCLRQMNVSDATSENLKILAKGIYMIELSPLEADALADVAISIKGTGNAPRPRVKEKITACKAGDFLAMEDDSVSVESVFREPKKIGLRGNIKAAFSGKSRGLVTVTVPSNCDNLLYSLRISTNDITVSSDGKFADHLLLASKKVKLFGLNVYEKRHYTSNFIDRLLFNTRPPKEEEAYCNMYVFTNATEAKRFQDETDSNGKYKYDVEQSQIGTQSCNGEFKLNGVKTIYVGFENERMRYDNYIWFDVVELKHQTVYVHPTYELTN